MQKVFDAQEMPDDIKHCVFQWNKECGYQNDNYSYFNWRVNEIEEYDNRTNELRSTIDTWLLENGAEDKENILISFWW